MPTAPATTLERSLQTTSRHRVDQNCGQVQASVAGHDNHAAYYGGTELTGHPDDRWGFAGQLALSIKNLPTGAGDTINMQGVYTDGATRYNIQDLAGLAGAATIFGGTNLPGAYQSIGFGFAPDTVFAAGGQQQLIKTWGFQGAYTHNWDPYLGFFFCTSIAVIVRMLLQILSGRTAQAYGKTKHSP